MTDNKLIPKPFAVVTGASRGIGFELAKQFALNGYDLLIVSDTQLINPAAERLENIGSDVTPVVCDLATYEGVEELYRQIQSVGRPVDAIAINAGVGVNGDFTRDTDLAEELNMISLNVNSSVHLAKRVLKDMVARGEGKVLFTSSIAGVMPAPFMAVYAASKAFLLSFSQALRNELKDSGVTVTALMPGPTDTNFFNRAEMMDTKVGQSEKDDPAEVARQGFDAMMNGDDHVVAGSTMVKVQAAMSKLMPETTKAEMHRKMVEPNSKKAS